VLPYSLLRLIPRGGFGDGHPYNSVEHDFRVILPWRLYGDITRRAGLVDSGSWINHGVPARVECHLSK
jgi:hypothetical protein